MQLSFLCSQAALKDQGEVGALCMAVQAQAPGRAPGWGCECLEALVFQLQSLGIHLQCLQVTDNSQ